MQQRHQDSRVCQRCRPARCSVTSCALRRVLAPACPLRGCLCPRGAGGALNARCGLRVAVGLSHVRGEERWVERAMDNGRLCLELLPNRNAVR